MKTNEFLDIKKWLGVVMKVEWLSSFILYRTEDSWPSHNLDWPRLTIDSYMTRVVGPIKYFQKVFQLQITFLSVSITLVNYFGQVT